METRRASIIGKKRSHPLRIADTTDFEFELGEKILPETLVQDPNFSVYVIDVEQQGVLFVETPPGANLISAPFYYQAQYENAIGLAWMPLAVFHQFAEKIEEPRNGFIFIHSVGRCGSTLVSKALEAIPSVHSLSEPDDLTRLTFHRTKDGAQDDLLKQLLKSSIKWRCKPRVGAPADVVAIKTRSEVLTMGDLILQLFPDAKHPFLYRDGLTWIRSNYQSWPDDRDLYDAERNQMMQDSWAKMIPIFGEYVREDGPLNAIEIRFLPWIQCMENYLDLLEAGMEPFAIRFEELIAQPVPVLRRFFENCGIEVPDWAKIEDVLGRDSQAGTIFDREERKKRVKELTPELIQDVRNLVATRPRLRTPDVILPGTVSL